MASQNRQTTAQFSQHVEREERLRQLINITIEPADSPAFSAIITDLSKHGLAVKASCHLRPFDFITVIKSGYGRLKGEVRWMEGDRFGVLVTEPINLELFNFTEANDQGHFVKPVENGHVWSGFNTDTSIRRPGVTGQFAKPKNPAP